MSEQADLIAQAPKTLKDNDRAPALSWWEWLAGVLFPILGLCLVVAMVIPGLLESKRSTVLPLTAFIAAPVFGVLSSAYIFATWPRPARTLFIRSFRAGWLMAAGAFYSSIGGPVLFFVLILGRDLVRNPSFGGAGIVLLMNILTLSAFVYLRRLQLHPQRKQMPWLGMAAGVILATGIPIGLLLLPG